MNYATTINAIIDKEKGYVDHPSDRGGPTKFGITETVARLNGFTGNMQDLPRDFAAAVYTRRYIQEPKFNKVEELSPTIAEELIDTGVNMGPGMASLFFQKLLNAFNRRGKDYSDIFVDGRIGPASLGAFAAFLKFRGAEGEQVFLKALNHIQGGRYLDIAENNESQEDFFYGWIKNRT